MERKRWDSWLTKLEAAGVPRRCAVPVATAAVRKCVHGRRSVTNLPDEVADAWRHWRHKICQYIAPYRFPVLANLSASLRAEAAQWHAERLAYCTKNEAIVDGPMVEQYAEQAAEYAGEAELAATNKRGKLAAKLASKAAQRARKAADRHQADLDAWFARRAEYAAQVTAETAQVTAKEEDPTGARVRVLRSRVKTFGHPEPLEAFERGELSIGAAVDRWNLWYGENRPKAQPNLVQRALERREAP